MNKKARAVLLTGIFMACCQPCVSPAQPSMAQAPVPLKDFARNDFFDEASISPDGAYLALRVPIGDQKGLAILDIATHKIISKLNIGKGRDFVNYWWASSKRLVFSLAASYGSLDAPRPTGELIAFDINGDDPVYLFGCCANGSYTGSYARVFHDERGQARVLRTLPNDPDHVLIVVNDWDGNRDGHRSYVCRMATHTGRCDQTVVAPLTGWYTSFAADSAGFVRYAVGWDAHERPRTYVRTPERPDWQILNSGELSNAEITPLGFSNDNSQVYLSSTENGDRRCLVRQNLASGLRTTLSCNDVADLSGVIWSFDGNEPIAAIYESGHKEIRLLNTQNPDRAKLEALEAAFPEQVAIKVSHTHDGRYSIVEVYSDRNPGDYYLFDTKTNHAQYLISVRDWIDPRKMAERRPISFKARDGQTLYGYLTIPPGQPLKNLPLVVNPHSGPFEIRDHWRWDADAQALASRGYAVLQVNFRGSGGYGKAFYESGRQGWDHVMIDDITDATHWAVAQGYADPKRLCIYGGGFGGYAALMSAVREPDLYRCVIDYAGVSDLVTLKNDSDIGETIQGRTYISEFIGADTKRLHDASPLTYIDRLKAAVMIIHGKEDVRVPYAQAKKLRDVLDARKYPYEWLVKSGEGHGFSVPENRTELYEKLIDFLNKNIGPSAQPISVSEPQTSQPEKQ